MRALALLLLVAGCAVEPVQDMDDVVAEDDVVEGMLHVCERAVREAATAGDAWTPQEAEACYQGCDDGAANGLDQGRLICIVDGDYCPECVADQNPVSYDVGYKSCFAEAYEEGFESEGCEVDPDW